MLNLGNNLDFILISLVFTDKFECFLDKIFDSNEYGYEYKMKVFKIDYERFNENKLE